ncbi:hypothetical protein DERP_011624 [Dermatophagoides pteronyssinus]|uniref:Uncharacterized protein n=1 Tax=Dermatophagoides pteronyssinus TaxID=6956 RepID=A0ABQ8JX00_DERPT|nr:hypothetical protein DERP_011624 [Dermatophagoides pteronyssinus]
MGAATIVVADRFNVVDLDGTIVSFESGVCVVDDVSSNSGDCNFCLSIVSPNERQPENTDAARELSKIVRLGGQIGGFDRNVRDRRNGGIG